MSGFLVKLLGSEIEPEPLDPDPTLLNTRPQLQAIVNTIEKRTFATLLRMNNQCHRTKRKSISTCSSRRPGKSSKTILQRGLPGFVDETKVISSGKKCFSNKQSSASNGMLIETEITAAAAVLAALAAAGAPVFVARLMTLCSSVS